MLLPSSVSVFVWTAAGLVSGLFKQLQYKPVQKAAQCIKGSETAPTPTNPNTSVFPIPKLQIKASDVAVHWAIPSMCASMCTLLKWGIRCFSEAFSAFIAGWVTFFTPVSSGTVGCGRADTLTKCLVLSEQTAHLPKVGVFVLQIVWSLWCNNSGTTCSETIHLVETRGNSASLVPLFAVLPTQQQALARTGPTV